MNRALISDFIVSYFIIVHENCNFMKDFYVLLFMDNWIDATLRILIDIFERSDFYLNI